MNKITDWFKGYFGTKEDEDETFEVEEENHSNSNRSRTDFSRPLILDEDELETYGVSYDDPKPVKSTHQVKSHKDEEIIYHSSEIISPFHGLKKEGSEHKERPKSRPSSTQKKDQTIISPYFGAVKKADENKSKDVKEEVKNETKLNTQEIKLNIKFDEDEYPETFDELRDWYREDDEK